MSLEIWIKVAETYELQCYDATGSVIHNRPRIYNQDVIAEEAGKHLNFGAHKVEIIKVQKTKKYRVMSIIERNRVEVSRVDTLEEAIQQQGKFTRELFASPGAYKREGYVVEEIEV